METKAIKDELDSYLALLQRTNPAAIDLDELAGCIAEAARAIEEGEKQAETASTLREDVISEIIRLSRVASALIEGEATVDAATLERKLSACETRALLGIRTSVRAGFASLLRSGEMPRKTLPGENGARNIADYRLEEGYYRSETSNTEN